jgi:hypothetical protein
MSPATTGDSHRPLDWTWVIRWWRRTRGFAAVVGAALTAGYRVSISAAASLANSAAALASEHPPAGGVCGDAFRDDAATKAPHFVFFYHQTFHGQFRSVPSCGRLHLFRVRFIPFRLGFDAFWRFRRRGPATREATDGHGPRRLAETGPLSMGTRRPGFHPSPSSGICRRGGLRTILNALVPPNGKCSYEHMTHSSRGRCGGAQRSRRLLSHGRHWIYLLNWQLWLVFLPLYAGAECALFEWSRRRQVLKQNEDSPPSRKVLKRRLVEIGD